MPHKEFQRTPARAEPVDFSFEGETFPCVDRLPMSAVIALVEESDLYGNTYAMAHFIESCIIPDPEPTGPSPDPDVVDGEEPAAETPDAPREPTPRERFRALLSTDLDLHVVIQIHEYLTETYAERPTAPSAG